jgi:hypothetical protein
MLCAISKILSRRRGEKKWNLRFPLIPPRPPFKRAQATDGAPGDGAPHDRLGSVEKRTSGLPCGSPSENGLRMWNFSMFFYALNWGTDNNPMHSIHAAAH